MRKTLILEGTPTCDGRLIKSGAINWPVVIPLVALVDDGSNATWRPVGALFDITRDYADYDPGFATITAEVALTEDRTDLWDTHNEWEACADLDLTDDGMSWAKPPDAFDVLEAPLLTITCARLRAAHLRPADEWAWHGR